MVIGQSKGKAEGQANHGLGDESGDDVGWLSSVCEGKTRVALLRIVVEERNEEKDEKEDEKKGDGS